MTDERTTVINARIKLARRVRKMTQVKLSELANTSQSLISFMEASNVDTDAETAIKIAKALNVSVTWLSGESSEGGVDPIVDEIYVPKNERDKISQRFIDVYNILKNLGIIENDFEFAQKANLNPGNLSNMLSGRYNVKLDLIPVIAEYGANIEYMYDGRMPKLLSGANVKLKSTEDTVQRMEGLLEQAINMIEEAKIMLAIMKS